MSAEESADWRYFVMSHTVAIQKWTLVSVALRDAYTDFVLSRKAMQCSPNTLSFYRYTAAVFLQWLETQGVTLPDEVNARYVRLYLSELSERVKDTTVLDHARAIRTVLKFWYTENYMSTQVKFEMPRTAKARLPVLSIEELQTVIKACNSRDKTILLFMVDSGLRRAETCALNWEDINFDNGLVMVKRGKGGKARSAAIGAKARRTLLAYRRTLKDVSKTAPLFQARGTRLTGGGLRQIFRRLAKKTGITITAHSLRRTYVIMSIRNGASLGHIQQALGHADLTMTLHYAQLEQVDLIQSQSTSSPIDGLTKQQAIY